MKILPQGKIIARGEDGVPWELYENGYLLFTPTKGKYTLTNPYPSPSWKEECGKSVVAIGFTNEVYAPEDSSYLFSKYNRKIISEKLPNLQYIETNKINTHKVTDMSNMFYAASRLNILDIGYWDTSNVTDMSGMFYAASRLRVLDIGIWNTSKVTDMSSMFYGTRGLTTLDIGKWDTSNVTNVDLMFYGANLLKFINISNWDMSNISNMYKFFYENDNLKLVDCSQIKRFQKIKEFFATIKNFEDCIIILPN